MSRLNWDRVRRESRLRAGSDTAGYAGKLEPIPDEVGRGKKRRRSGGGKSPRRQPKKPKPPRHRGKGKIRVWFAPGAEPDVRRRRGER